MFAAPAQGVVFLAMPKCASTAVEAAARSHAELLVTKPPSAKHVNYRGFVRRFQPELEAQGYRRSSYQVVCLFREPVEWLGSWWRYRSRPKLAGAGHDHYTGDVSFDEFVRAYIDQSQPYARVGSQARFVSDKEGWIGVDRIYRLDRIAEFSAFLAGVFGIPIELGAANVSPSRTPVLAGATAAAIHSHLVAEYHIYDNLTVRDGHSPLPERMAG